MTAGWRDGGYAGGSGGGQGWGVPNRRAERKTQERKTIPSDITEWADAEI